MKTKNTNKSGKCGDLTSEPTLDSISETNASAPQTTLNELLAHSRSYAVGLEQGYREDRHELFESHRMVLARAAENLSEAISALALGVCP